MSINDYIPKIVKWLFAEKKNAKIKLRCGKDRISLEMLLELHGATIDRRERLVAQKVIYATISEKKYEALAQLMQHYGKRLEKQNTYSI